MRISAALPPTRISSWVYSVAPDLGSLRSGTPGPTHRYTMGWRPLVPAGLLGEELCSRGLVGLPEGALVEAAAAAAASFISTSPSAPSWVRLSVGMVWCSCRFQRLGTLIRTEKQRKQWMSLSLLLLFLRCCGIFGLADLAGVGPWLERNATTQQAR